MPDGGHYFNGLLGTIRGASPEFRLALADEAIRQIQIPSGTKEHAKAVTALACLGDIRLVKHLEERLVQNGLLQGYESHALIALGTDDAGALFARAVMAVGERLSGIPNNFDNNLVRHRMIVTVRHTKYDICYLLTRAFEPHLKRLIDSDNSDVSWISSDLAKRGRAAQLLYPAAVAACRRGGYEPDRDDLRDCVTTDVWLSWWSQASDPLLKRRLLHMLPLYPSAEVEEILIECLDSPTLRKVAASELGAYGIVRSAARLRGLLAEAATAENRWTKAAAAHSLGDLRDDLAVPLLAATVRDYTDDWVVCQALWSLGLIGGREAENTLERFLGLGRGEEFEEDVLEALLLCGSRSAVRIVVERARSRSDGPCWLFQRLDGLSEARGWRRGEYYTHIYCDDLVDYLASQFTVNSPGQDGEVEDPFCQIDGPTVRNLLREWAGRSGPAITSANTGSDSRKASNVYFESLRDRGDESAIDYTLDEREHDRDGVYVSMTAYHLLNFPSAAVSQHLRRRLADSPTLVEAARLLALLGRFGERVDAELASRFLNHPDDLLANVACETMLRLSDPLLVPDH